MSQLLETAISLLFVYLLFSLLVSWVNELLTARANLRGRFLRHYLSQALHDPVNANWGEQLYAHPVVRLLARRSDRPPAYIPSHLFALALIDLLLAEGHRASGAAAGRPASGSSPVDNLTVFRAGLAGLQESDVQGLLHALSAQARNLEQVQARLAVWYDEYMDRVGGWYKRRVRGYLFVIALLVSVLFHVDSLRLARAFYQNGLLRTLTVAAAGQYVQARPAGLPVQAPVTSPAELNRRVELLQQQLTPLQVPIGWHTTGPAGMPLWAFLLSQVEPSTLLGWLLSAFALSFGAPFWFDVLQQLVNVRSVGAKPTVQRENSPATLTQQQP